MEDNLWWKATFDGRQPLLEDNLSRKTAFYGRWTLMEEDLWWKTIFDERQPLMEDNLWWETAFNGRWPSINAGILWRTTLDCRRFFFLIFINNVSFNQFINIHNESSIVAWKLFWQDTVIVGKLQSSWTWTEICIIITVRPSTPPWASVFQAIGWRVLEWRRVVRGI